MASSLFLFISFASLWPEAQRSSEVLCLQSPCWGSSAPFQPAQITPVRFENQIYLILALIVVM